MHPKRYIYFHKTSTPTPSFTSFTTLLWNPLTTQLNLQEVDERNSKLLQTLSEATDMLAKADEMQAPGGMVPVNKNQTVVVGWLVDQLGAQYVLGDHR